MEPEAPSSAIARPAPNQQEIKTPCRHRLRLLHIASFSGNIGDNANHMGFRPWFEAQIDAPMPFGQIWRSESSTGANANGMTGPWLSSSTAMTCSSSAAATILNCGLNTPPPAHPLPWTQSCLMKSRFRFSSMRWVWIQAKEFRQRHGNGSQIFWTSS